MPIRRPRISKLITSSQFPTSRSRFRPKSKCPIHMHPTPTLARKRNQLLSRIESPGIHIPGLQTNNRGRIHLRKRVHPHPALRIRRHSHNTVPSQSQQGQRLEHSHMSLIAHNHGKRGRTKQTQRLHIPALSGQQGMPCRRQSRKIGHRRPRNKRTQSLARDLEQRSNPPQRNVFQLRRNRRHHLQSAILIPTPR